ncbi:anthranilate synthase family protein [Microbacterium aerolatum]|uniref:anthranilate synthase n=1 Tax=Microbacterium aerolatum TaxID=153731 RepID=A0A511AAG4_9MICO|nr:chorismate-binding protein [Microbacterium aerolatum]GEK85092.1 phenazine-specific anthranilate synthase component I [Microbacterium aerolatum]GGB38659.1 phenazine-specific anthranilate synthase component I [Microbacterium aerolatum]
MTDTAALLAELVEDADASFVLIARDGAQSVELLTGPTRDVDLLADIPLTIDGTPREVFAMVPYRQVRERGFAATDDGTPLRCLIVDEHRDFPLDDMLAALPAAPVPLEDAGFDISDEDYAEVVSRVIAEEIGRGEGANFVIRRDYTATVDAEERSTALAWFRALLTHERGAYWTFAVITPGHIAVGASPEAHVVARDGIVTMNPISGTFRHPAGGATKATLIDFLSSTKETEELFMVVDEELKMMSAVCSDGGRITGPHLKQMSRLTHTEYMLRGRSRLDPRDILRETMFAPTVTGSPMQNACAVIRRHETTPRGYYSGVAALFTPNGEGGHDVDAPILIRTVYLEDGRLRVPVGATLVRHSDPYGEVSETHGKAAGVLGAIGAIPRDTAAAVKADPDEPSTDTPLADDPEVSALLASRNSRLAEFWLNPQEDGSTGPFAGRTALVVDAEDRFTTMLAHQLRHLGLDARIMPWHEVQDAAIDAAELLVAGPGPGDPRDASSPRIARMRELVGRRLDQGAPLLAVCLSHQILADRLGLDLAPLAAPHQGLQKTVPVFGEEASIGFYNTFTAQVSPGSETSGVSADPATGDVYALRGDGYASVQGHLESILSRDGIRTLERLIEHALRIS